MPLSPKIHKYLLEHIHDNIAAFALKKSPFEGYTSQYLSQQLHGMQKAKDKLPSWFLKKGIRYPPKLNLEQTSSEAAAHYKASLLKGKTVIDLTGGFGVDSIAFAKAGYQTTHIEQHTSLQELVQENIETFDLPNIQSYCDDGISFLENSTTPFDTIYIDPARRTHDNSKLIDLKTYEPNVINHLELFMRDSKQVLVKVSPIYDIQQGIKDLKYVSEVHVVSVKNEVKEVLFKLESNASDIKLIGASLNSRGNQLYNCSLTQAIGTAISYAQPKQYLYEPHPTLMKLNCHALHAHQAGLDKLARLSHLYTSKEKKEFFGRIFKINQVLPYKPKQLKKRLPKKANITIRNFKQSVKDLRSKLNIQEGGEDYLFFTTQENGDTIVVWCRK